MTDDAEMDAKDDASPDPATNGETATSEEVSAETGESLADRLAGAEGVNDELRAEVADLEARVDSLESEADELRSKLARKQADFQNYKKRTKKQREQLKDRATEELVERLVPVRDNLLRALDQDESADIRPGVESTLTELDRVLEDENVTVIEPAKGDDVDPHRHEVMLRVDSDQPAGTVVELYQPGYEMAEKVLRPAQVTVSDDS